MFKTFGHAGDADVFFDDVVVGRDVGVADGPVFAVAILRRGFEIPIAEAEADAAPDVGAAAGHPHAAHPIEGLVGGRGVGLFEIVDEPVVSVFVANFKFGLDGAGFADDFFGQIAIFEFERGLVFGEVFVGLRAAGFEKGNFQAGFREALAGPASGSAGADDDDVVRLVFLFGHEAQFRNGC